MPGIVMLLDTDAMLIPDPKYGSTALYVPESGSILDFITESTL